MSTKQHAYTFLSSTSGKHENVQSTSPPNTLLMLPTRLCHAGMGYQAYLNMGGAPRGTPGFNEAVVYDPIPSRTMPFLLMISVLGAFLLTQMRKLMICDWKLPFPSGTASGIMLTSFHTAVSPAGGWVLLVGFRGMRVGGLQSWLLKQQQGLCSTRSAAGECVTREREREGRRGT
jgi:hypothetical protein